MAIDLNIVADQGSGQLLPDLNEQQPDEQGDKIHHLREDQVHLLYEGEHRFLHGIDLNLPGNVSLTLTTSK
jgi:hypothetical protein